MNAEDIAKILDELGERLGPVGSHVWELVVRQSIVDGAINVLWAIVMGVLAVAAILVTRKLYKAAQKDAYSDDDIFIAIFGGVITIGLAVWSLWCGMAALRSLLNPEWQAIQVLLQALPS